MEQMVHIVRDYQPFKLLSKELKLFSILVNKIKARERPHQFLLRARKAVSI